MDFVHRPSDMYKPATSYRVNVMTVHPYPRALGRFEYIIAWLGQRKAIADFPGASIIVMPS